MRCKKCVHMARGYATSNARIKFYCSSLGSTRKTVTSMIGNGKAGQTKMTLKQSSNPGSPPELVEQLNSYQPTFALFSKACGLPKRYLKRHSRKVYVSECMIFWAVYSHLLHWRSKQKKGKWLVRGPNYDPFGPRRCRWTTAPCDAAWQRSAVHT
jgi:hypothetical protein